MINKSGKPIYVIVLNSIDVWDPKSKLIDYFGKAIKVENENSYTKKISLKGKTTILIYTNEPNEGIYAIDAASVTQLPCEFAYPLAKDLKKTVYVSWTPAKGLYPQTGKSWGLQGVTRAGFSKKNNVGQADLISKCVRNKIEE